MVSSFSLKEITSTATPTKKFQGRAAGTIKSKEEKKMMA